MSEFESMKEAMQPILDAQTEQTEEWCEKHQRPKVRVKKTGTVLCLKCGYEERREFEEQKAQASYKRNEERKRLDRKSTRLNSSHLSQSRMPSSA